MLIGLDEAGRGPALGPLVLCAVCIDSADEGRLARLDVRDSKAFGSNGRGVLQRQRMARVVRDVAIQVVVQVADAAEVDRWRADKDLGGLNRLEQELARQAIDQLPPARRIIADGARLFAPLRERYPQLEALNRADQTHAVVSAASVVAKTERDQLLADLLAPFQAEFGPIKGSGYPNPATARFLSSYVARHHRLPQGVRRSWSWPVLQQLVTRCGD